jgi:hypothetical protein
MASFLLTMVEKSGYHTPIVSMRPFVAGFAQPILTAGRIATTETTNAFTTLSERLLTFNTLSIMMIFFFNERNIKGLFI